MVLPAVFAAVAVGATVANAFTQAAAARQKASYEKMIAKFNAEAAKRDAVEALRRGTLKSFKVLGHGRRMIGAQAAAQAAGGIQLDFGSAAATRNETETLSELDALEIRNQAHLEVWGYESQAAQYEAGARYASAAGRNQELAAYAGGIADLAKIGMGAV